MSSEDESLDACHCCEGVRILTPAEHVNRPGLAALAYRVGTHGTFKATMQARISAMPALRALGTRDNGDFTIALLDAWATVADVLSFYTERVANEGLLRTATEFRSVQEHARSIGYESHPGVAASTYLAFTVEDSPGAEKDVPIPAGTRAQNIPEGDELPQTFETIEDLLAHPEWNAMRPRQTEPQLFDRDTNTFYFEGTNTGVNKGDWMLLFAGENKDPENPGEIGRIPLQVVSVVPDQEKQHTRVELIPPEASQTEGGGPPGADVPETAPPPPAPPPPAPPPPVLFTESFDPLPGNVATLAAGFTWSADDADLFAAMHTLSPDLLPKYLNNIIVDPKPDTNTGIFAMRVETAPFGHTAPKYLTLPPAWINEGDFADPNKPFPRDWDSAPRPPIAFSSDRVSYKTIYGGDSDQLEEIILLDSVVSEILPGSWILLKGSGDDGGLAAFRVRKSEQVSRADFALNAKVTALTLETNDDQLDAFHLRTTTIYAQSEPLALAARPLDTSVQGDTIELDHKLERRIYPGQRVVVSGTPEGLSDAIVESELAIVSEGFDDRLVFKEKLQRTYRRDTVRLSANVAPATHGESRKEVLGFGDASQSFQSFQLSHAMMTYTSAPVPSGSQSTLELRVNGVLWKETEHFFGLAPNARRYVLRRDDQGKTTIVLGDGNTGQRPPTGSEISANYRSGLGAAGNLSAGKISLLVSQPRWVQNVTQPVPANGGADPESATDARRNAPNSVRTFGRIVSLQDFEDFARSFAGVSKAKADLLHFGDGNVVHVTIAGEKGASVPTDSDHYRDLVEAMERVRDPFQRLLVASYEKRFFDVAAKVRVHPDYQGEIVLEAVKESLRETFSFELRELGQGVTLSEVVATMQRVRGVEAIDLDVLRFSHERHFLLAKVSVPEKKGLAKAPFRLLALSARRGAKGKVLPTQHLSIFGIQVSEMP